MFKNIAIVGVGLIGGSIGMAARKNRLAHRVIGAGRRQSSIDKALRKGAIDKGTLKLKDAVSDAELIVIATPVDKVIAKIKEVSTHAKKGAIIMDVNSTKGPVLKEADKIINKGLFFVGTHPVAGSEQSGVLSGNPELFKDTICIITPTNKTDKYALKKVESFWKSLGAITKTMSAKEHDRIVANISHLPHLIAYALCDTIPQKDLIFSGTGLRDTTRIAKSSPEMWQDIFMQNQTALLKAIEAFQEKIKALKSDIKKGSRGVILEKLSRAERRRRGIG